MSFDQNNFNELPPLPPAPPTAKSGNWVVRHKFISGGIAAVVGLGIIGAVAGSGSEKEIAAQASTSAPTVSQDAIDKAVADALAKQAAPAAPSATPTAETVSTPAPTPEPTPAAEASSESDSDSVNFAMPNFVGMNLQDAQDKVQTYGIFFSVSHDLNGSRMQILDSNWKVCNQNIKPGTKVKGPAEDYEGKIDFGTVKIEESCP